MEQKMQWQMRGKESDPIKTVERIKSILDSNGFPTELTFSDTGVENLYSCRVELMGEWEHQYGTNGKGMSKELAMASAYGELMERLQNQMVHPPLSFHDTEYVNIVGEDCFRFDPDNDTCPVLDSWADTIFGENVIDRLFGDPKGEILSYIKRGHSLNGKFEGLSLYSIDTGEMVIFPRVMLLQVIASNGMAAGNTIEEAFTEAASEIFERYASSEIAAGKYVPPVIPADFVKRFPQIYALIEEIESSGKFQVRLLDCSLGKGLPVVACVIFNKETETYGVKFGSHPYIAIALERVFTEATQGNTLDTFTVSSGPEFNIHSNKSRRDFWNQTKIGVGKTSINMLLDEPSYPFEPWGLELQDNQTNVRNIVDLCRTLGVGVYVEDVSSLGFPAVLVYAGYLSDIRISNKKEFLTMAAFDETCGYITHLHSLTEEEIQKLYNIMKIKQGDYLENTIDNLFVVNTGEEYPGGDLSYYFLMMVLAYTLGRYDDALTLARGIASEKEKEHAESAGGYNGLIYLFDGLNSGVEEKQIWSVIKKVCPDSYERLYGDFGEKDKVIQKLYPECHKFNCNQCPLTNCGTPRTRRFHKKLADLKRTYEPNYDAFRNLMLLDC